MSTDDQQKRGGLVPIGTVAVRWPGIEGRGRAMSARARHHFTTLRQVNQLIEASEAEPDLGFMARLLALSHQSRGPERVRPAQRTLHAREDRRDQQQSALRQHPASAPGVGLHRSGTHAAARARPRPVVVRVHAKTRHGESKRGHQRRADAAQKSNTPALSVFGPARLRGC